MLCSQCNRDFAAATVFPGYYLTLDFHNVSLKIRERENAKRNHEARNQAFFSDIRQF